MDDMIDPSTGIKITPSYHGKDCLGNGEHPGHECCCDNCEHFLNCYPEENVRFEESLKLLRVRDDIVTQEEMEREFNLPPLSEVDTTGVEFEDEECELIERLAALSAEWKAAYAELNKEQADIPLVWEIDVGGMLRLDGIWICPAECVDLSKPAVANGTTMSIQLDDGCIDIAVAKPYGYALQISKIERMV